MSHAGVSDDCPICLGCMDDPLTTLRMPVCGHLIHTSCALSAAQYDVRCPMCRTIDPEIDSRRDRESRIFSQIEEYATHQEELARNYKLRRAAVIRRHESLKKLRSRARQEKKAFSDVNLELDRTWMQLQRRGWNEDPSIQEIKRRRRRQQRRVSNVNRSLHNRLRHLIGTPPESIDAM